MNLISGYSGSLTTDDLDASQRDPETGRIACEEAKRIYLEVMAARPRTRYVRRPDGTLEPLGSPQSRGSS